MSRLASTPTVGPCMLAALRYIEACGGVVSCAFELAKAVGPNRSAKYGYRTVGRCERVGLIAFDLTHPQAAKGSNGAIVLTDAGRAALHPNGEE